jgi:protein BUR2
MVSATMNAAPPPPRRELPPPPLPAVVESEQQWVFTEEELLQAPSIADGMPAEEERTLRRKGVNFILQVGMMLKLPQTTLSTAAVFFNRYLMRKSLKPHQGYKPLHQYVRVLSSLYKKAAHNATANRRDSAIPCNQSRRKLP